MDQSQTPRSATTVATAEFKISTPIVVLAADEEPSRPTNIKMSLLSPPVPTSTYENVSDVESLTTDSEGEIVGDEESSGDEITAAKFLSSIYFGPSEVKHSETRRGVSEAVTHSCQGESKGEQEVQQASDLEEDGGAEFHQTDCEDVQGSDSDSECLVISESGMERYLESTSCQGISETTESFREARRVSDLSDMEDGKWMDLDDTETKSAAEPYDQ